MGDTLPDRVRLGDFEVDLRAGEVRSAAGSILLQEKSLRVLNLLIAHAGRLVTRDEIQKRLWPNDTIVDYENGINTAVKRLRQALQDSADAPKYIENIPRRGYRLLVPVETFSTGYNGEVSHVGNQPPLPNLLGMKVSHYRVLEIIGGGGMGLVYKAEDLKLGRQVALKFLPDELACDTVALQRFEREARTASSLDHPNICTIYEVEEYADQPFIVMQLLKGQTLRDRLAGGKPLQLDELLEIAVQTCEGLQAAHSKGIIHRDIKPANVFLTNTGQVKILDFGLAKLVSTTHDDGSDGLQLGIEGAATAGQRAGSASLDATLTRLGTAMGTAGYMSPEQVRGEKLDARTDIFSFGLVLYEMATGQRAFTGDSVLSVHNAILKNTPPSVRQLNPEIPLELETIINKTLEKDREQRYPFATDLRASLRNIAKLTATVTPDRFSLANAIKNGKAWLFLASLIVALVAIWPVYLDRDKKAAQSSFSEISIERLSHDGHTKGPTSISPDGKYVIYEATNDNEADLWLREVATSRAVKLVPNTRDKLGGVTFSPDGSFVYYQQFSSDEQTGALYRVSTLGGIPQKILSNIAGPIGFSPDGERFTYVRSGPPEDSATQLMIANADGGNAHPLATARRRAGDLFDPSGPSWSPDGKLIAVAKLHIGDSGLGSGIALFDMQGHETTLISGVTGEVARVIWLKNGEGLVFSAEPRFGCSSYQLWYVSYPRREVSRITHDLNDYGMASLGMTADGSTLVTVQDERRSNLFVVKAKGTDVAQITESGDNGMEGVDAAAKKIVFTSMWSVFVSDAAGLNSVQLSPGDDPSVWPAISRDGAQIAFTCWTDGRANIWSVHADGSHLRQVSFGNFDLDPVFSSDANFVYFRQRWQGKSALARIDLSGHEPVKNLFTTSDLQIREVSFSHRGDLILGLYFDRNTSRWRYGILSAVDGTLRRSIDIGDATDAFPVFTSDDRNIVYKVNQNSVGNLWELSLAGDIRVPLTRFQSERIFNFAVAPDGTVVIARGHFDNDIVLIRRFR